jgi:hypothetical protein
MRLPPRQKTRLQVRQTSRLSAAIQRVFKSFRRNEGSTDHGIIPTIELLSDFSVIWKFSSLGTSTATMWGTELKLKAALSAAGKLTMLVGDGEFWRVNRPSDTAYNDGVLRKAEVRKTGDLYELLVENVVIISVYNAENVTPEISQFYRKSVGGEVFPGILADFEVYDDGVLVRDYPIDDNSDILANKATLLGSNVFNTSYYSPRGNSTIVGDIDTVTISADSSGTFGGAVTITGLVVGTNYLVSGNLQKNYSDGFITPRFGSDSDLGQNFEQWGYNTGNSGSRETEALITATSTTMYFGVVATEPQTNDTIGMSNIVIRKADGYGNLLNSTADQWGLFRKQSTVRKPRLYRVNKSTTDYVQFPTVNLSTDSKISFDVQADLSENIYCFGNDTGFNSRLSILENGSFNVRTDTNLNAFDAPAGTIQSGVFTNLAIRLLGGVIEVFIDKVSIGTNTTGGAFNINTIFKNSDAVSGKGVVANFKLEDAGVVVRDYAIDDNNSTLLDKISAEDGTVVNGDTTDWFFGLGVGGEWLGQEGLANGNFANGLEGFSDPAGNWSVVNKEAVMGLTSSYTPLRTDLILKEGVTYRVPVDITAITGEMLLATLNADSTTSTTQVIDSTGNKIYSVIGAGGPLEIRRNVEASVSLDNLSVKEVVGVV